VEGVNRTCPSSSVRISRICIFQSAPDQIIARAQSRFNMKIEEQNLEFVYLHRRRWVEAEMYPYLTLLGQSLGSVWLGEFPRP